MVSGIVRADATTSQPQSFASSAAATASTSTPTSSSRCWLPLVYSSMAILLDHRQQDGLLLTVPSAAAATTTTTASATSPSAASLFPCHSWVLAAVVCELLLLDGTLEASTMTAVPSSRVRVAASRPHVLLSLSGEGGDEGADSPKLEEDEDGSSPATTLRRHEWHSMSRESRANFSLRPGDDHPEPFGRRGGGEDDSDGAAERPTAAVPRQRRKKRKRRSEEEGDPVVVGVEVPSASSASGFVPNEDDKGKEPPSAERLVATILGRVVDYAASHPLAFPRGDLFHPEDDVTPTTTSSLRKVSDVDKWGTEGTTAPPPPAVSASYPMSVGRRDLARHWEHCRALAGQREAEPKHIQQQQQLLGQASAEGFTPPSPPTMMEASIVTEQVLRGHALEMTRVLLETFETQHLRRFFGYRKPSSPRRGAGGRDATEGGEGICDPEGAREGLVRLVMDFVFDASHAMFAWQDFELTTDLPGVTPTASATDCSGSQKDRAIAAALFDDRALRHIGGVENGSIVRLALALGRCHVLRRSWADVLTSSEGRQLVEHHFGTREKQYSVGEKRRGRRMRRNRVSNPLLIPSDSVTVNPVTTGPSNAPSLGTSASVEVGPRSRASSIASLDDDVPDASHGRLRIRMSRTGNRWGVKLCKIGDMCVVENCGALNLSQPGNVLQQGDNVLFVANPHGNSAHSPAYKSQTAGQHWFRDMVNLFSNSKEVILSVQRVESFVDSSTSSVGSGNS